MYIHARARVVTLVIIHMQCFGMSLDYQIKNLKIFNHGAYLYRISLSNMELPCCYQIRISLSNMELPCCSE